MRQVFLRIFLLGIALLLSFPAFAHVSTPKGKPGAARQRASTNQVLKRLRVAQAKSKDDSSSTDELKLDQVAPRGAWVLESIAVTVAAAGFISIAVGATFLGRRDQLIFDFENPSIFAASSGPPDAKEIGELQDNGFAFLYTGLILTGVGLVGMVVGGIWILAHKPPASKPPKNASLQKPLAPIAKAPTSSHTLTLHQGQF